MYRLRVRLKNFDYFFMVMGDLKENYNRYWLYNFY